MGAHDIADAFTEMERLEEQESRALKAGVQGRKLPELSPWEYVWRLTYAPDGARVHARVQPHDEREALQLALAAERRAETFYSDTAAHAPRRAWCARAQRNSRRSRATALRQLEHFCAHKDARTGSGCGPSTAPPAAPRARLSQRVAASR
jgi:hypothetical protein